MFNFRDEVFGIQLPLKSLNRCLNMSQFKKFVIGLILVINLNILYGNEILAPVVTLPDGKIQGHVLQSPIDNTTYYAYQEIPYASPPVGNLRFKEPVAPAKWNGTRNTTHNTRSCFISGILNEIAPDVTQTEDCLYLNVYTPVVPGTNASIPVLFWIHGGGYTMGDGTFQVYGPQFLIDFEVVIVTINYRLGPLGFLSTEDDVIPGNFGIKDQHLALQWVQNNIALFGGDPKKITIDGESAGGSSVGLHLISKKSEGLFRGAILQSGTAICSFTIQKNARSSAFSVGKIFNSNFTSENSTDLLKLLQSVSAAEINNVTLNANGDSLSWVPVIESKDHDGAFITDPMHEDIRLGNIIQVPILLGFNSEEEISFMGDEKGIKQRGIDLDNDVTKIVSRYNMPDEKQPIAGPLLRKVYTSDTFQKNQSATIKYASDADFTTPIIRHAVLQSNYTDVYLYQFSYKGVIGAVNVTRQGVDAVGHAEDLKYLWHIDRLDDGSLFSVGDRLAQRRLLKLWTNFVKYLNPTPESDPVFDNILWPKVSPKNISYLNINRTLEVRTNPRQYQEVTAIIDQYAKAPLNTY